MGCFLPCFGASKRTKHVHSDSASATRPEDQQSLQNHVACGALRSPELTQQRIIEQPIHSRDSKIKLEDQSNSSAIKKVTFDLNANVNEELSTKELIKKLEESNIEPQKAGEEEAPQINDRPNNIRLSRSANPPDYRYGDCSDEEYENLKDEKKSENEEDGGVKRKSLPEESSESLFSLSIDSRKQVSATEEAENEVNSSVPLRGYACNTQEDSQAFGSSQSTDNGVQNVSSEMNPIENLAQGTPIKPTGIRPSKITAKEDTNLFRINLEGSSNCIARRKVNFDLNVNTNEESSAKELIEILNENKEDQEKIREEETPQISECPKFIASGKSSHLSHYRYQDCSNEECEDINLDESDFVDYPDNEERGEDEEGEVKRTWVQEESSESLFSLSTSSRKQVSAAEKAENEVNSPRPACGTEAETEAFGSSQSSRARVQNVSSVLNPIENLTQGKAVKATVMQPLKHEKENINSVQDVDIPISPEPSLKLSNGKARQKFNDKRQEIGVDTSLSSWLVETETTPKSKNSTNSAGESTPRGRRGSPVSHEDRPILGALTIEELRKFSVSTSSRRTRSRSPDETPIIGTVGSYWSHTGQSMDSNSSSSCGRMRKAGRKSREDAKMKWNSTPFKARLERALEASAAQL